MEKKKFIEKNTQLPPVCGQRLKFPPVNPEELVVRDVFNVQHAEYLVSQEGFFFTFGSMKRAGSIKRARQSPLIVSPP